MQDGITKTFDLTGYDVSGLVSIRFRGESGGASNDFYNDLLVDNITIGPSSNCTQPLYSSLNAANITTNSADLSWTAGGNETQWNIQYGPSGFFLGYGTTLQNINSINYSLSGLNSSTNYDFYVQSICSNSSLSYWVGPYSFITGCSTFSAPYTDYFNSSQLICWTQDLADQFDWTINANGTPSQNTGPSDDVTVGGSYIYIETSSPRTQGDKAILYSPEIDISGLSNPELRFFTHMYGAYIDSLLVDISNNSGASYINIFNKYGDQGNQWNHELVDLSSYSGNVQFRITAIRGQSWAGDIAIDNFHVGEACTPQYVTDVISSCVNYTWIDGVNYTTSNNSATFSMTSLNGCDSIVTLDLTINTSTTGIDTITACNSHTWIDGITYTSGNNTATHTLTSSAGCDSIVTLRFNYQLFNFRD